MIERNPQDTEPARFRHASFAVLRTPLLALEEFFHISGDDTPYKGTTQSGLWTLDVVREALSFASPAFATSNASNAATTKSRRAQRADSTLYKYGARMAGRATPYGLFAGVTLARTGGSQTDVRLRRRSENVTRARLDIRFLHQLSAAMTRDPELRMHLRLTVNSTLYGNENRIKLTAARDQGEGRNFYEVALNPSRHLLAILEHGAEGATLRSLVQVLLQMDESIEYDDAIVFIESLVEHQTWIRG